MNTEVLAQLRDIHWPPPPAPWPPAPGLLLLAATVLLLAGLWAAWRRRPVTARAAARREWRRIAQAYRARADDGWLVAEVSQLLRRAARARDGARVAGLAGAQWRAYLAQRAPEGCDPRVWDCLASQRYRRFAPLPVDGMSLLRQCRRWLEHDAP